MASSKDPIFSLLFPTLQGVFSSQTTPGDAASRLASISLKNHNIELLWVLLLCCARESPEQHPKLVSVVVEISKLPDVPLSEASDVQGPDSRLWRDLPRFGWELNSQWNSFHIPTESDCDQRRRLIAERANIDTFTALLMKTGEPVFNYQMFALWTFRAAFETHCKQVREDQPLEAWLPAAVAWLKVLGSKIYEWDVEFESGGNKGAPGRGGPLWEGKHEFCKERWSVWRERSASIAEDREMVEDVRQAARRAVEIMQSIEKGL